MAVACKGLRKESLASGFRQLNGAKSSTANLQGIYLLTCRTAGYSPETHEHHRGVDLELDLVARLILQLDDGGGPGHPNEQIVERGPQRASEPRVGVEQGGDLAVLDRADRLGQTIASAQGSLGEAGALALGLAFCG